MRSKKEQHYFDEGYFSAMRDAMSLDIEHYGNGAGAELIQEFNAIIQTIYVCMEG